MYTTTTPPKTNPQDMPPKGGYEPLTWKRQKLKTFFTVKKTLGLYVISTIAGSIGYFYAMRDVKREEIEMRSARQAMLPMLIAERDRAFLKQLNINREEERELMKNDPEWEVGTYYREPVYITVDNQFHEPRYQEFMGHAEYFDVTYRMLRRHFMS
ncbi:NADH dehydrogenase [ubiquinone] 1 alpha subcomplex subunit 13 [Trichogramma pretiosum]|uniref:NADH dehydrogenase [ubiquinone] 1 alpha subcomplex subunit 13 n=1 Tax=Trichogramma kaykai TaxID=54128 RepID=A0ABD2WMS3_9HYME|nr:NADH dehydrogenase [ubiquinone] 1 alpha subcomplex subunit 13 [Trichogramma pretiosum]